MPTNEPPDPLPLSLPAGVRSRRRAVVAAGVVVLTRDDDGHGDGYLGNWQPIRVTAENPARLGWSWLPARVIDWSSVR